MLKKAYISSVKAGSEEWREARLAKFTSSEISYLTYPTGFTEGSINYIRRKVGEELTGKSCREEFTTPATMHGHLHEAAAVKKFGIKHGLNFIITQQLIVHPGTRFGSTPDGLIIVRESPDGTEYEAETVEVKCPPSFDAYIELFECGTPAELKKANRDYYWQVIDQMLMAEAKRGHFVVYHPDFKAGNHKSMAFEPLSPLLDKNGNPELDKNGRKIFPIKNDLNLLKQRKQMALDKFDEIRSKLMAIPAL